MDGDREETQRWGPESEGETEAARERFEHLRARGFMACRASAGVRDGGPLTRFDPDAEEILLIRFVDGG